MTTKYNWREVPRDPKGNAIWRKETLDRANRDHEDAKTFRRMLVDKCREDFWFWATGFAFLHEPRILDDDGEGLD